MRHYELMVILGPQPGRAHCRSFHWDTFLNVVRQHGGTIDKVDVWGKRRLAYEILKHAEGIYAVIDINATPATVA